VIEIEVPLFTMILPQLLSWIHITELLTIR
jgi:hypothetical protein